MVIEPSLERVREARELLHGHFGAARVVEAQFLARRTGKCLRLKLETQLRTGSFRVRGAVWALAARLKRESVAGVVASSTGNHGAAVAWTERSQLLVSRLTGEVRTGTLLGQVLGGFRQVQTLQLIFSRSFSHSAGALARVFLMADSSIFEGNRLPHRGAVLWIKHANQTRFARRNARAFGAGLRL